MIRNTTFTVRVAERVWTELCKQAKVVKSQGKGMKAFMFYYPRGKTLLKNIITDLIEIPVRLLKPNSPSGPIFRWDYEEHDREKYYPSTNKKLTNTGTAIIQPNLDLTLHYAFWMGREYGKRGSGGFHISIWLDDEDFPKYKAYYVNADGKPKTDGEFIECEIKIISSSDLSEF